MCLYLRISEIKSTTVALHHVMDATNNFTGNKSHILVSFCNKEFTPQARKTNYVILLLKLMIIYDRSLKDQT